MPKAHTEIGEAPPVESGFKRCESIALSDQIWEIRPGLKKFTPEEAAQIITSHGGTLKDTPLQTATHELKYAKDTYAVMGPGTSTIFEPGFVSYIRSQTMYHRIQPKSVDHYSLGGLSIVFAGTLPWLKKEEYKELVEEFGGRVQKKVNTKTNYVVLGYKDVPDAVMADVEKLGVRMLDEEGFVEMIRKRKQGSTEMFGSLVGGGHGQENEQGEASRTRDSAEKQMQDESNVGQRKTIEVVMGGGEEIEKAPEAEKGGKKKKEHVHEKHPHERRDREAMGKKPGGVKKSGGAESQKAQKEHAEWAGRLRHRVETGEEPSAM